MGSNQPALNQPELGAGRREAEIERLVQKLKSLQEGESAVGTLIGYGQAAIPALRRFLLAGRPGVVYQPRRWAVEALAGIGARSVLIEYLKQKRSIADAAVRFDEMPVENAAARALAARWQDEDTFQTLLEMSRRRARLGFVEALARFRRADAIPYFLHALEDDIGRSSAEEALRAVGPTAIPALVESALTRLPSAEEERPSSARRRAGILELLSEMDLTQQAWQSLRPLIDDSHAGVVIAASKIAARMGDRQERMAAACRLLEVLLSADWYAGEEIGECLKNLYDDAREILEARTGEA